MANNLVGAGVAPLGTSVWAISSTGALVVSADGGNTWTEPTQPPVSGPVVLSRVSPEVAFVLGAGPTTAAGSRQGALARTEDGGRTWQPVPLPQGFSAGLWQSDLVASSASSLWLVAFGQPVGNECSKRVYRSDDGGAHWTLVASANRGTTGQGTGQIPVAGDFGPLFAVAAAPDTAWLAEDRGGLLVTTDGGASWQPAFADPAAGAEGPPSVTFLDASHGWAAVGIDGGGLWRTTDRTTWTEITSPPGSNG